MNTGVWVMGGGREPRSTDQGFWGQDGCEGHRAQGLRLFWVGARITDHGAIYKGVSHRMKLYILF